MSLSERDEAKKCLKIIVEAMLSLGHGVDGSSNCTEAKHISFTQAVRCQVVSIILEITVQFADNPVNSRKLSTLYTDSITKGTDVANVGQQWNGMLNSIPDAVSYVDTQVFFD